MNQKPELTPYEMAALRLQAFHVLKGWGHVREDGKWKPWDSNEAKVKAEEYVDWALNWNSTCSFCSKASKDVKKLIAGTRGFICNECVPLCAQIMKEELPEELPA
jgi:hypothetical protein